MSPRGPAPAWRVRLTSKRGTGNVLWVRQDGSLTEYLSDAGRFTAERARHWRTDISTTMHRWEIAILEVA